MEVLSLSERQFLELLRLGLWGGNPTSIWTEPCDWDQILTLAQQQTVTAICYDGITLLPAENRPARIKQLEWWTLAQDVEAGNRKVDKGVRCVFERLQAKGIKAVLLKGQGVAQYYQHPNHRHSGDIDIYCDAENYPRAIAEMDSWEDTTYKDETIYHRSYSVRNWEVEVHSIYQGFYHPKNNERWQQIQALVPLDGDEILRIATGMEVSVPQPQMNAMYIFTHAMHHLLQVGIGFRQVCDWLCLWKMREEQIDKALFVKCADIMHTSRIMAAMLYVAVTYLGYPRDIIPLDASTPQAKKDGEFLLRDMIVQGNFGKNTDILKGVEKDNHLHNLKNYWLQAKRLLKMRDLFPDEAPAYPVHWLKQKLNGTKVD